MKRQKISIRITPKKQRKTWQINPVQRVHAEPEYNRGESKEALKRALEEQLEDE